MLSLLTCMYGMWYTNLPCDVHVQATQTRVTVVNISMARISNGRMLSRPTSRTMSTRHMTWHMNINPNRAQTEHVRGGYSRGYAVALLASSSGIANKQEQYTGIFRMLKYLFLSKNIGFKTA